MLSDDTSQDDSNKGAHTEARAPGGIYVHQAQPDVEVTRELNEDGTHTVTITVFDPRGIASRFQNLACEGIADRPEGEALVSRPNSSVQSELYSPAELLTTPGINALFPTANLEEPPVLVATEANPPEPADDRPFLTPAASHRRVCAPVMDMVSAGLSSASSTSVGDEGESTPL